jgi:hypothetical protein
MGCLPSKNIELLNGPVRFERTGELGRQVCQCGALAWPGTKREQPARQMGLGS